MKKCVEKDKYPLPIRAESRRWVQGGREEAGNITLELGAELAVGRPGRPRYRAAFEWPGSIPSGKKSGTAEVCAFVSLQRQGAFVFPHPSAVFPPLLYVFVQLEPRNCKCNCKCKCY